MSAEGMMRTVVLAGVLAMQIATTVVAATVPTTRDWRTWPFSASSPWNTPIGSGAQYAPVSGLAGVPAAINYDNRWTGSVVVASSSDPTATMLYAPATGTGSVWTFFQNGGQSCGNTADREKQLASASRTTPYWEANYYSTLAAPDTSQWLLPPSYHKASQDFRATFRLPAGTCPSPDTDSFVSVVQPDGWVLDVYNAVVLSDERVVGTVASYIDAKGDGTGWWNGRRASMLPSFAGLVRTGEIASGVIRHALVAHFPPALLKTEAVWPAATFDRNAGYSGTMPMGSLLAIPPSVDVTKLGLSSRGVILARAAQDYGVYVADRGGSGVTFLAEMAANGEVHWPATSTEPASWSDVLTIKNKLQRVTNNGPMTPGGGGTPRAPLAPPFTDAPSPAPVLLEAIPVSG